MKLGELVLSLRAETQTFDAAIKRSARASENARKSITIDAKAVEKAQKEAAAAAKKAAEETDAAMKKAGAAFLVFAGAALKTSADVEEANGRLARSFRKAGATAAELDKGFAAADKAAHRLGVSLSTSRGFLDKLTKASGDHETALRDLALAQDIAATGDVDAKEAVELLTRARKGEIEELKKLEGINATTIEALQAVADRGQRGADAIERLTKAYSGASKELKGTNDAFASIKASAESLLLTVGDTGKGLTNSFLQFLGVLAPGKDLVNEFAGALANFAAQAKNVASAQIEYQSAGGRFGTGKTFSEFVAQDYNPQQVAARNAAAAEINVNASPAFKGVTGGRGGYGKSGVAKPTPPPPKPKTPWRRSDPIVYGRPTEVLTTGEADRTSARFGAALEEATFQTAMGRKGEAEGAAKEQANFNKKRRQDEARAIELRKGGPDTTEAANEALADLASNSKAASATMSVLESGAMGLVGPFASLWANSESFNKALGLVDGLFQDVFGGFIDTIGDDLVSVLEPFFKILGELTPAFHGLLTVMNPVVLPLKILAKVADALAKPFQKVREALRKFVNSVKVAAHNLIPGSKKWDVDQYGNIVERKSGKSVGSVVINDEEVMSQQMAETTDGLAALEDAARRAAEMEEYKAERLGGIVDTLTTGAARFTDILSGPDVSLGLGDNATQIWGDFYDRVNSAARANEELAESAREASESLTNVPQIFRANLRRAQASEPGSGMSGSVASGFGSGVTAYAGARPGQVGTVIIDGNVVVVANDTEQFSENLQRRRLVQTGNAYAGASASFVFPEV